MSWSALWCKSNFSFLEGASFPEQLVKQAAELGLAAVAITDRDGVYGAVRAHVAAKEAGVKLITGSQITVDDGSTAVLLCRSEEGYRNLCSLISAGRLRCAKGESRVSWSEIQAAAAGLVALIPPVEPPAADGVPWAALREAFGDHLYLAYAKHLVFEDTRRSREIAALAARYGLAAAATPEVLYHHAQRRPLQDVLTCIRHKVKLEEAGGLLKPNDHFGLNSYEEIRDLYTDRPEAVANTLAIAAACSFTLDEIRYTYPDEQLPGGHSVSSWLRELVARGVRRRYPGGASDAVRKQIHKELSIIEELEYGGYFLTMYEIVRFCRQEGILCQGRGSAANSIVCYCLGITAVDPVQMDLLFERFLSVERAEPPDIDLDIEHQRREEVIQHMYAKYGRDRAAMVANVVRYRPKSAVRDVGRALGFPTVELERMAKNLGIWWVDFEKSLDEALGSEELVGAEPTETDLRSGETEAREDETFSKLEDASPAVDRRHLLRHLCRQVLDFPRHLSIHPGGFILGSRPIDHLVPVENATMPDRTVIQWDKYDVEALGLFKVDLLGLGALTHLRKTMELLKVHRNIDITLQDISAGGDDPEVYGALNRSDTVGVFQVESRAQMAMLPRLKPRCFYDLVIEISIVRPGPISGGLVHPYLRRRSGEEDVTYPHPSLKPVLGKTLGIPIFQEQVMKLAVVAADYSPGEADQLRRDMAAWRSSGKLSKHKEKLITRMVAKGIKQEFAEAVYRQIQGFGEYGFPESHAASFALIAYATAWFKVKYPAFFACGLLNAWPMGFYSPASIVEDAKRHDVPVLPIDVTMSRWECMPEWVVGVAAGTASGRSSASPVRKPASEGAWGIRMGLRYVKGLSRDQGRAAETAQGAEIRTVEAFAEQTRLDAGSLKALSLCGALESLEGNRRSQLWRALGVAGDAAVYDEVCADSVSSQVTAFLGGSAWKSPEKDPIPFGDLSDWERIAWDYSGSLHSAGGHPLEPHREALRRLKLPDSAEVRAMPDGSRCRYAGVVICRQRPGTANGVVFMTLEDEAGFVNLVLWQRVYEANRTLLFARPFLGVEGTLQSKDGSVNLIVESCFEPPLSLETDGLNSRDFR